jgi:hypothetical protein
MANSNLATWFTPSLKVMSRSNGDSAVAAAAYRACVNLEDERMGKMHQYKDKWGHVSTELIGFTDIAKLWNDAEKSETRKNSSVCREIMVPMPHDWTDEQRILCARGLGEMLRARYGVAVQVSIHRQKDGSNDHVHILFTTRVVDENGVFGKKTRILDEGLKNGEISNLREAVCDIVNLHAKANGSDWFAYAGKFKDIDPDHIPTVHIPRNCPKEMRDELEAKNIAILEARDELKRLSDESKAITEQVNQAIETAKNPEPLPVIEVPTIDITPTEINIAAPTPEPRPITPLARAMELRDNAETMAKFKTAFNINTKNKNEWNRRLKVLEDDPSQIWYSLLNPVLKVVESLGVKANDTMGIREREMERLKKIEHAKAQLATAQRNEEKFLKVLNHSARIADLAEWNRNPNHKAIIEASRDPTPDEIYAKLREHQEDAYKPPPEPDKAITASNPWDTPWSYPEPKRPWDEPPY